MTRITREPWFGPKQHFGWGWRPVSWQGWVITLIYLVLAIVSVNIWHRSIAGIIAVIVLTLALVVTAMVTGDRPGGRWR